MDKVYPAVYAYLVYCNTDNQESHKKQYKETSDTWLCRIFALGIMYHLCSYEYTPCYLSVFYSERWLALSYTVDVVGNDVDP
jgi:hypothetical protein